MIQNKTIIFTTPEPKRVKNEKRGAAIQSTRLLPVFKVSEMSVPSETAS